MYPLNGDQNFIADSVKFSDLTKQLFTQVWVYYAPFNPTEKLDSLKNYGAVEVIGDADSEDASQNGTTEVKTVLSRWMNASSTAHAVDLGRKILARHSTIPRAVSFKMDAKDNAIKLGDFVQVSSAQSVDFEGVEKPINVQIFSEKEETQGTTFSYDAQEFAFAPPIDTSQLEVEIGADVVNYDMREEFDLQYGVTPQSGDKITFIIRSGVTITGQDPDNVPYASTFKYRVNSVGTLATTTRTVIPAQRHGLTAPRTFAYNSTYTPRGFLANPSWPTMKCGSVVKELPPTTALRTGVWPAGVELKLIIEAGARILGAGGNGGAHDLWANGTTGFLDVSVPAGDGGHAMKIESPIIINNLGSIFGGGGGGSAVSDALTTFSTAYRYLFLAGGGGSGGNSYPFTKGLASSSMKVKDNLAYQPLGAASGGGTGVVGSGVTTPYQLAGRVIRSGDGGGFNGRKWALNNEESLNVSVTYGTMGYLITEGKSLITWENRGWAFGVELD